MPHEITFNRSAPYSIGVDVGGTKIAAALVDAQGRISGVKTRRTDISSPEKTLDSIASTVLEVISETNIDPKDIKGVGLGIPGIVDPERGIGVASVNLQWRDVPVVQELQSRLGIRCVIENDVKVAALGELKYGVGRGLKNIVYLNIGTGVAAAVILEGKIYRGHNGMAGEIGHAVVDVRGPRCKCGGRGCLEAIVSGPAIVQRVEEKIKSGKESSLRALLGGGITLQEVYEAAAHGDLAAAEATHEVAHYLAVGIQFIALAYDPQRVILGGGVVYASPLFMDYLLRAVQQLASESWVFRDLLRPDFIQLTSLGTNIGILGAAALVDF
ncbi:ROK family protein [Thermanaerothrix sp.]|uniref:ROK family protein n=1 Tax=Thermanaerothrix sp. TaxID=2972675 RepID=UPI002ADDC20E|nr:ROK family protein [Thermanaerothrix sp.]